MRYRSLIIIGICLVLANPAYSQSRGDIREWYKSLMTPNDTETLRKGLSCCDEADCKIREVEYRNGVRGVIIEEAQNQWFPLPDMAQITDPEVIQKNPHFQLVACYVFGRGIICWTESNSGG